VLVVEALAVCAGHLRLARLLYLTAVPAPAHRASASSVKARCIACTPWQFARLRPSKQLAPS
jgi:hypothetical protein